MFTVKFTSCDFSLAKHHRIATILQPCIPALCRTDAPTPRHTGTSTLWASDASNCAKHSSSRSAERTFFKNEDTFSQVILFTNPSSNTSNYEICRVLHKNGDAPWANCSLTEIARSVRLCDCVKKWAFSSVGRAGDFSSPGRGFDPRRAHHFSFDTALGYRPTAGLWFLVPAT